MIGALLAAVVDVVVAVVAGFLQGAGGCCFFTDKVALYDPALPNRLIHFIDMLIQFSLIVFFIQDNHDSNLLLCQSCVILLSFCCQCCVILMSL